MNETADFLLLHPAGRMTYGRRGPGESIRAAIRRDMPHPGTQGLGRLPLGEESGISGGGYRDPSRYWQVATPGITGSGPRTPTR